MAEMHMHVYSMYYYVSICKYSYIVMQIYVEYTAYRQTGGCLCVIDFGR